MSARRADVHAVRFRAERRPGGYRHVAVRWVVRRYSASRPVRKASS